MKLEDKSGARKINNRNNQESQKKQAKSGGWIRDCLGVKKGRLGKRPGPRPEPRQVGGSFPDERMSEA